MKKNGRLRRLDRKTVYNGAVLDFCRDTVQLPDGKTEEWDFIHHRKGGGACVVPVLPDGRILMIRQYRPAVGRETLELPAGGRDAEESTARTAARELREETGYRAADLHYLCTLDTAVAYCDEQTDIYLAEGLTADGTPQPDEAEDIRTVSCKTEELLSMIASGEIRDAKTVAGILAYVARKDMNAD